MRIESPFEGANYEKANPKVIETLIGYRHLGEKFEIPPEVRLVISPHVVGDEDHQVGVRDIAITTAMQCYAPGVSTLKPRPEERQQAIADSTAKAGHHTTRIHANYTFILAVTRDLAETTLHFTPFYNSEQQSQRYVEARQGNYEVPSNLSPEQRALYLGVAEYANQKYAELLVDLRPHVEQRVRNMYPGGGWNAERTAKRLETKIDKTCQEIARYVLPIAQKTRMYHTLNELQLLRLFRASQMKNFTDEARYVVASMIEEIATVDPSILLELNPPLPQHDSPHYPEQRPTQREEFDAELGGRNSVLVGVTQNPGRTLATAVRNVIGASKETVDDTKALELLMDPRENPLLSDVYETGMLDPLTSALRTISVTFMTRLSHTAESQRQRHRRTFGDTPTTSDQYDGAADYITPLVVREDPELKVKYEEIMGNIYRGIRACVDAGVPRETSVKLLPNAHAVRTVENGDLFDWLHRLKQRLCYLAQEEFCFISIEQAEQLLEILPDARGMLQAPCGVAHVAGTGKCPEGERWCGKAVWNTQIEEYKKGRLI